MKRISQKRLTEFVGRVAKTGYLEHEGLKYLCYFSKIDGSYFSHANDLSWIKALLKRGIVEQLQNIRNDSDATVNLGFNPEEQKWYGWSHRAMYGFGIGSKVKRGDCAYCPKDKDDFLRSCVDFSDEKDHFETRGKFISGGVEVSWIYGDKIKNKKMRCTISSIFSPFPEKYGKGEWTAKTLEDAKQMAMDFAESVG